MKELKLWSMRIVVCLAVAAAFLAIFAPQALKVAMAWFKLKWAPNTDTIKNAEVAFNTNVDLAIKRALEAVAKPGNVG
jgi:hypothetical protein